MTDWRCRIRVHRWSKSGEYDMQQGAYFWIRSCERCGQLDRVFIGNDPSIESETDVMTDHRFALGVVCGCLATITAGVLAVTGLYLRDVRQ